jgi:hypothetical protein
MPLPDEPNIWIPGVTKVSAARMQDIEEQIVNLADGVWAALQTFTLGAVAAVDQHFTVSGDGRFKHGDMPRNIPAGLGRGSIDAHWEQDGAGFSMRHTTNNSGTWFIPIPIINGERLKYVQARVKDNTTKDLRLRVYKVEDDAETRLDVDWAGNVSDGSGDWQDIVASSVSEVCSGLEQFYAAISILTPAAEAISVQGLFIETDWP